MLLSSKTFHLAGTRKLRTRFLGYFRVMKRIGKTVYRLDLRGRFKDIDNTFHISQLRKHIPGGSSTNPPELIQVEGEEHFKVEALLQHRTRGRSW